MLHHVDRGRILEQPAGKHRPPCQWAIGIGALFDIDLDEGAGFRRPLPGQGPLASGQAHHDIADTAGFAGLQDNVLGDIVALVEQPQRGDTVLDRCTIFTLDRRGGCLAGDGLGNLGCGRVRIAAAVAGGQQQDQTGREQAPHGQASGLHAS